jgi:hypothetical protein
MHVPKIIRLAVALVLSTGLLTGVAGAAAVEPVRADVGRLFLTTESGKIVSVPFGDACTKVDDRIVIAHNATSVAALLWSNTDCGPGSWYPLDVIPPFRSKQYDPAIHVGSVRFHLPN